ncbi:hypothetical protein KXV68_008761 [Aspergillus fumigatus]|nr:hypothetical protein KXX67_003043 [Aspergillus fumigatus]KAH1452366.1 hypothetical protein KXX13_002855 [Aspergillus fumigatus]KAH2039673.1 hypothetical protein KXV43_007034 [Aspergillus fumigatus]KAH2150019.1 hypothetical protein KXV68_008761 [Aspergillus fumigatus]KAH2152205.1 hypothetical protein KXW33_002408 [Aspergillus fumigatus]
MAKESSYLLKHYLKLVNELRELKQANDSKEFSLKERVSSFKLKITPSKADEYSGYGLKRVPTPYPLMARN